MVQPADRRIITEASLTVALDAEAALARNADNLTSGTVADARIPSTITRDTELAAEAALARDASNLTSGTIADARIPSTITRDTELAAEATLARNADNLTSGTIADARIPSTIARDSEVSASITAAIVATITDGDTTHAPSGDAVFDALAAKAPLASPAFTGNPTVPTATFGDDDTSIASTAFVAAAVAGIGAVAAGTIILGGWASAPSGHLLCDGAAVSRTTYANLFTAIGTAYGVGDGSTTFNVPNLKGRVPIGKDAAQTEFDALGETGGSKTHSHSLSDAGWADIFISGGTPQVFNRRLTVSSWTPTHSMTASTAVAASTAQPYGTALDGTTDLATGLPPYVVLNYAIKT